MRKKSLYITLALIVLLIGILAIPALADAGNFSGSSDFGGGSFSSGGSYDFGGSSSYSGSSGLFLLGGSGGSGLLAAIILVIIVFSFIRRAKRIGTTGTTASRSANYSQLMPIETIRNADPNFSEAAIQEKIGNLYVRMQGAWQEKEFDSMRPFMTDALFNQFKLQLDELVRAGQTNYVERIAVLNVDLTGWRSDEVVDAIVALVNTRIIDYTVDDRTGKLISGSKTAEKFMTYEWTLTRSKGRTTPAGDENDETTTVHCPSCGAPVEINQSAKCPYCGSVINAEDFDWVISSIRGISQRTGH